MLVRFRCSCICLVPHCLPASCPSVLPLLLPVWLVLLRRPCCLFLPHFSATALTKFPSAASLNAHTHSHTHCKCDLCLFLGQQQNKSNCKISNSTAAASTCDPRRTLQQAGKSLSLSRGGGREPGKTRTQGPQDTALAASNFAALAATASFYCTLPTKPSRGLRLSRSSHSLTLSFPLSICLSLSLSAVH